MQAIYIDKRQLCGDRNPKSTKTTNFYSEFPGFSSFILQPLHLGRQATPFAHVEIELFLWEHTMTVVTNEIEQYAMSGSLVTRNNRKREFRLKQRCEKRAKTIENEIRSEKSLKLDVTSMSSTRRIRSDLFILRADSGLPDPIGNCVYLSTLSPWSWSELLFFLILSIASTSRSCVRYDNGSLRTPFDGVASPLGLRLDVCLQHAPRALLLSSCRQVVKCLIISC